jgi:hypothetical protein
MYIAIKHYHAYHGISEEVRFVDRAPKPMKSLAFVFIVILGERQRLLDLRRKKRKKG